MYISTYTYTYTFIYIYIHIHMYIGIWWCLKASNSILKTFGSVWRYLKQFWYLLLAKIRLKNQSPTKTPLVWGRVFLVHCSSYYSQPSSSYYFSGISRKCSKTNGKCRFLRLPKRNLQKNNNVNKKLVVSKRGRSCIFTVNSMIAAGNYKDKN